MSRRNRRSPGPDLLRLGAVLGAVGLAAAPLGVAAQSAPGDGGVLIDLTASQSLRASDNPDLADPAEGEILSVTGLRGSISSVTRQRSFILGFQAALEIGEDGFELGDTGVDLTYAMTGARSELEIFADYLRRNITSDIDFDADDDIDVISGTQIRYGYGARLTLGRDAPLGASFEISQREVEFDTLDPDATDSSTFTVGTTLTAAIDSATDLRFSGRFVDRDEDDADGGETTTTAGVGVTRRLGPATTLSADVNWQDVDADDPAAEDNSGVGGRLSVDRDLANGSFGAFAEREFTAGGTIDSIQVSRAFEFPASALRLAAGIAVTGGDTVAPLLGIAYQREAPDGRLSLSLTQDAALDADDESVLNTIGRAAYTRDINAVSGYQASLSLRNQNTLDTGEVTRIFNGSLSYNRALTANVDLVAGYEYAHRSAPDETDRSSNTVFVTISRRFQARP